MALPDTPDPRMSRGRGGNFRPLVIRGLGAPRIQEIAGRQGAAIGEAIIQALLSGQGVLFSPTRDQGAISVILYGPGDPQQTYAASETELKEALEAIRERSAAEMQRGTRVPPNGRQNGS
jgi:hypothetical protein